LIPLDLASFGGPNLGDEVPMRCSYYPQSLAQIRGAIQEIGSWIWGSWPMGAVHRALVTTVWPVLLTGLTGADLCWVLLRWTSG
jgi:hypothetical protein